MHIKCPTGLNSDTHGSGTLKLCHAGTIATHSPRVFIEENALGRRLALLDGANPRPYTDFTMFF